jgi:GH15 family glucan-1,4-alpha-glucosidase
MAVRPEPFFEHDLEAHIVYVVGASTEKVEISTAWEAEQAYWSRTTQIKSSEGSIQQLFSAASQGLRAVISSTGKFDSGIWQYGMQWGRDASRVAEALVYSGQFELAKAVLTNILTELTNDEGMVVEASRFRAGANSELDSNGLILMALGTYLEWTGDEAFIKEHWKRISLVTDYIIRDEFVDAESGLLKASRDIWERMEAMGIEPGFDVAHQSCAIVGLDNASKLTGLLKDTEKAKQWHDAAHKMRESFLSHASHSFIKDGKVRKRIVLDGSVQTNLHLDAKKESGDFFARFVPDDMPLAKTGEHKLEPDVIQLLPIILGIVDPKSNTAKKTFEDVTKLWSEAWEDGGLGRYDISGEPDSPGPWSLATIMFAQAALQCGEEVWYNKAIEWLVKKAGAGGSFFEFYGSRPTPPLPPIGILPWSWAEIIILVVRDMLGATVEHDSLSFDPKVKGLSAQIRFRDRLTQCAS